MKNYISSFFSITYHDCDKLNYNTSFFYCKRFSSRLSTKFDIVLFHPIKYTKSPQKPTHFVVFVFIFSRRFLIFFSYSSDGIIYIIIKLNKSRRVPVQPIIYRDVFYIVINKFSFYTSVNRFKYLYQETCQYTDRKIIQYSISTLFVHLGT